MKYTIDTASKTIKVLENVKLVDLILTLQASLEDWEQYTLVLDSTPVNTFDSLHKPFNAKPLWMYKDTPNTGTPLWIYKDTFNTGTPLFPNTTSASTSTGGSDFNL